MVKSLVASSKLCAGGNWQTRSPQLAVDILLAFPLVGAENSTYPGFRQEGCLKAFFE
jgi:hypothetical protein